MFIIVEINETDKTFHFLNKYDSFWAAQKVLQEYKKEVEDIIAVTNKPTKNVRWEIVEVQNEVSSNM